MFTIFDALYTKYTACILHMHRKRGNGQSSAILHMCLCVSNIIYCVK